MGMRSLEQLARDQEALVAAYRARLPSPSVTTASVRIARRTELLWGKVSQVVTADPEGGPHLVVDGYMLTGHPLAFSAGQTRSLRCYPAPGKVVSDYAVDDYVRLTATGGAMVAERVV